LSKWPCFLLSAPKAPPFTQLPPLLVTKPSMVKMKVITVSWTLSCRPRSMGGMLAAASKQQIPLDGKVAFYFETQYTYTGNKNLAPRTKETYNFHYRNLWKFLAHIGDFDSMLMLLSPRLKRLPAMKVESLMAYIRYKKMSKSTVLSATQGGVPIVHVLNQLPMHCQDDWKANRPLKQFTSALSRLHVAHYHTTQYLDACGDCCSLWDSDPASRGPRPRPACLSVR